MGTMCHHQEVVLGENSSSTIAENGTATGDTWVNKIFIKKPTAITLNRSVCIADPRVSLVRNICCKKYTSITIKAAITPT